MSWWGCAGTQNMRASQVKPVRQMYVELMITCRIPAGNGIRVYICLSTENYHTDAWETKAITIDVVVIT